MREQVFPNSQGLGCVGNRYVLNGNGFSFIFVLFCIRPGICKIKITVIFRYLENTFS